MPQTWVQPGRAAGPVFSIGGSVRRTMWCRGGGSIGTLGDSEGRLPLSIVSKIILALHSSWHCRLQQGALSSVTGSALVEHLAPLLPDDTSLQRPPRRGRMQQASGGGARLAGLPPLPARGGTPDAAPPDLRLGSAATRVQKRTPCLLLSNPLYTLYLVECCSSRVGAAPTAAVKAC